MPAVLTNTTGVEMRLTFIRTATGKRRYINNLYIPNTAAENWDLETVVGDHLEAWESSGLAAVLHEQWALSSIQGRVRGNRPDAGVTYTEDSTIVGTVTGVLSPDWLTWVYLQEPDNVNRLVLVSGTSIFRKGRISMPSPPGSFVNGNNVSTAARTLYDALIPFWLGIPANPNPVLNPGFSLAMTRVVEGVLQAKCNVLDLLPGELGHQDTARD